MLRFDILVIGAGIAGMAAAIGALEEKNCRVLVVDSSPFAGGVLQQCLHRGFGSGLTGPEYAKEYFERFRKCGAELMLETEVVSVDEDMTAILSSKAGLFRVKFERLMLACGCTETVPASLEIAGTRPDGVYTAGYVQKMINVLHEDVGSEIAIAGCGDLGMIMAGTLKTMGKNIVCMVEKNAVHSGLSKNYREYIENNGIRVDYNTTVRKIIGTKHITGVELSDGRIISCDTLVVAAGLKPDRRLAHGLGAAPWLDFCGNCLRIYDMVETVARESLKQGQSCSKKLS